MAIELPEAGQPVTPETFQFSLRKKKLRQTRRREGCYLLRSNLTDGDPAVLWQHYIQLTEIEQAFKELKGDLGIRPIYHQLDHRIEAHIFVAFIAYCLQVTLKFRARRLAPGLTPRAILEKFSAIQMVDVHLPTTDGNVVELSPSPSGRGVGVRGGAAGFCVNVLDPDKLFALTLPSPGGRGFVISTVLTTDGRHLVLPRFTQPDPDQQLLLKRLGLTLPNQPPPRLHPSTAL